MSPVLTEAATKMVGPTTFSALASEPVATSLWDGPNVIPHTRLGQRADLVIVCPATARLLADLRLGRSADLLTATLISTEAPVIVCPAMHTEMWNNPAVQDNVMVLQSRGVVMVGPGTGRLAGGDSGPGRLADVDDIMAVVYATLSSKTEQDFLGTRVLVTAGGTREPIDPVRYISNRSSGRQGHALAECAAGRGADVTLVTTSSLPAEGVSRRVQVETAQEMSDAVDEHRAHSTVILMAAAVSDYRVKSIAEQKLKKSDGPPHLELVRNDDILAGLGQTKMPSQIVVGFAAETQNLEENAAEKLMNKRLDIIVANDVSAPGVGFDHPTNAVTIIESGGTRHRVGLTSKLEVASAVLDVVSSLKSSRKRNSRE